MTSRKTATHTYASVRRGTVRLLHRRGVTVTANNVVVTAIQVGSLTQNALIAGIAGAVLESWIRRLDPA
jgi:hypothetical protein